MGWETRKGKRYYYRSKRVNGRVVKEYCGTGPAAEEAARLDAEAAAKRRESDERFRKSMEVDALLGEAIDWLDARIAATMIAAGFHRSHGEWRKKRKPRAEANPTDASGSENEQGHAPRAPEATS